MRITVILPILFVILAFSSCSDNSDFFGKTAPPPEQDLVYTNGAEPETLDPHKAVGVPESHILDTLFDGLTKYHPKTLEPIAAIATHYSMSGDSTIFTFYLRGHAQPRGVVLPNPGEQHISPKNGAQPARWSDGNPVTASDFVYAWRRAVDPETAAPYSSFFYFIRNAEEINSGKLDTRKLGVSALDPYTLQIELRAPTPFFPRMLSHAVFSPLPQNLIQSFRSRRQESSWTRPENIVTNGAFLMKEWRPYDKIVVARNPDYYEAHLVRLNTISFLPVVDSITSVNLYKAGQSMAMTANNIPQPFIRLLKYKKDFRITAALGNYYYLINTTRPPFNNVLLRYALNMATDKRSETEFLGAGELPAATFVPPIEGYRSPEHVFVETAGKRYDVLAYNVQGAQELMALAGYPQGIGGDGRKLRIEIIFNTLERHKQIAEIVQQQWQKNLNVDVVLLNQEWKVFVDTASRLTYSGLAKRAWVGDYVDPNSYLDLFVSGSVNNGTGWTDARYDRMLAEANATTDPVLRMKMLAECETTLLRNMPIVPLHNYVWYYLQKPYVRDLEENLLDQHPFKYVWIDTAWREK